MTDRKRDQGELILLSVVAAGWLAVILVPLLTRLDMPANIQIGVQAAMMLVLGAVFKVRIDRKSGNGSDRDA
jgi:hypothetical protein